MVELDFAVHMAAGLNVASGQDFSVGLQVALDLDDEVGLDFATGLVMFISWGTFLSALKFMLGQHFAEGLNIAVG